MRIVVLVKHVPDAGDPPCYAADLTVDRAIERGTLNAADGCAIEQALSLARARIGAQVSVLTMGPAQAARSLLAALALGADDAVHVCDEALHGSDALATSLVLAAAVRKAGYDLLLCGTASSDSGMAIIPVMLAERLRIPVIHAADAVCADESSIIGFCSAPPGQTFSAASGVEIDEVACDLPALVAVTDRAAPPRTPSFPAIAEARHKLVRRWTLADLGVDPALVGVSGASCRVRAVSDRRAVGPIVVDGTADPAAAARAVAEFLADHDLV